MMKPLGNAVLILFGVIALGLFAPVITRAQNRQFTVQTASKETEAEARAAAAQLAAAGYPAHWVKAEVAGKGTRYRVRFGRFNSMNDAKARAEQAVKSGVFSEYLVTPYEAPSESFATKREPPPAVEPPKNELAKNEPTKKDPVTKPTPATVIAKQPENKPAEKKPEPVAPESTANARTREVKPSKVSVTPIPADPTPKSVETANEPKSNKTDESLAIAQPPMADALGELDISNRNWKVVRKSLATDKNLRSIFFIDSMTGWAAGDAGALHRTTDGGKTWKPLLSGAAATITQIQFVDWNTGWLLGEMTRKEDETLETVIFATTNGGRSWSKKALPNIQSIWFTDAQTGWAVGKNGAILQTSDGGNEWKPYADAEKLLGLPVESSNYNFGYSEVYFLDPNHGWLIGNFYGRAATHIGGLFYTEDAGVTWKRVPFTVQTQYTSGRLTPGTLQSVRFTDTNTGTVTGEMVDGTGRFFFTLHTRDGGKNWEQYRTPSRAAHSTQFFGPAVGWTAAAAPREGGADAMVYDTTLMRTENGGASWQNDFVARGNRIRSVFFLSPKKGWAVGDRGMILRYEEKTKTN